MERGGITEGLLRVLFHISSTFSKVNLFWSRVCFDRLDPVVLHLALARGSNICFHHIAKPYTLNLNQD